jgi:hypothetical protein
VGDIDFLSDFCRWKFKINSKKTRFWKEKSVDNMVTLRPTARATLVLLNLQNWMQEVVCPRPLWVKNRIKKYWCVINSTSYTYTKECHGWIVEHHFTCPQGWNKLEIDIVLGGSNKREKKKWWEKMQMQPLKLPKLPLLIHHSDMNKLSILSFAC